MKELFLNYKKNEFYIFFLQIVLNYNLYFIYTGYVKTTDLGIARLWKLDNASDTSGTPGYMGLILFLR